MKKNSFDLSDKIDYELAGARLLGRDIGAFIDNETKNEVLKILEDETGDQQQYPLIEQMTAEIDFEHKLKMIEELKAGIKDSI
jgi:predicted nucleotidyltransferase